MKELEKYNKIFCEVFCTDEKELNEHFTSQNVDLWDSIGHMNLISAIEEEFDIMLDEDDIMAFRSYSEGLGILKKYRVCIEE